MATEEQLQERRKEADRARRDARRYAAVDAGNAKWVSLPETVADARRTGKEYAFTGRPCEWGHIARRLPKPKPTNTVTKYSEVRPIILELLDQPRSFKDLIIATNGDVSDSTIREVLRIGIEKGELIKPNDTYILASAPQTAVAAITG